MSASLVSLAGGLLLAAATLPQALALVRHRRAGDFGWPFAVLNFVGLVLLAWRSFELHEWAFFGVNVLTSTFWGLVILVKLAPTAPVSGPGSPRVSR